MPVEGLGQEEPVAFVGWFGAVGVVAAEPELDDLHQLVGGELLRVADEHGLVTGERLGCAGVQCPGEHAGMGLGDRRLAQSSSGLGHRAQLAGQVQPGPGGGPPFAGAGSHPVGHRRGRIGPVCVAGLEVGGEGPDHRAQLSDQYNEHQFDWQPGEFKWSMMMTDPPHPPQKQRTGPIRASCYEPTTWSRSPNVPGAGSCGPSISDRR